MPRPATRGRWFTQRVRWLLNVISAAAEPSIRGCGARSPRVNPHY